MTGRGLEKRKVIVVGVGNSGTKVISELIWQALREVEPSTPYYYEPLYWKGNCGEQEISLNPVAINEHVTFPLLPVKTKTWTYIEQFIDNLDGLAKFIRLGSRIGLFIDKPVKYIWITRELEQYLGSMLKNFPRCLPHGGWHHRPGGYDDFERLCNLYPEFELEPSEPQRVLVEAAWWHLHNQQLLNYCSVASNMEWIRFEDLCTHPKKTLRKVFQFLRLAVDVDRMLNAIDVKIPKIYEVGWIPALRQKINRIAGDLNQELYN